MAVLETDRMREAGQLILEEAVYSVYREGVVFGRFVLEREDGEILAVAKKPSAFARKFMVEHDGSTYVLRAPYPFRRRFHLYEEGRVIGSVSPAGLLSWSALADLPDDLSLPVRAFVLWLVLLLWKRGSGYGGGGG